MTAKPVLMLEDYDRNRLADVLESGPSYDTFNWQNEATGMTYAATPMPVHSEEDKRICRDVEIETIKGATSEIFLFTACKEGSAWSLVPLESK